MSTEVNNGGLNGSSQHTEDKGNGISADEVALYDRQIRLWGMEAQERLRNAHVLLITMKALANEVAKNLVLAGIGALTVMDNQKVTEEDLGAQFLVTAEDIGQNRAVAAVNNARKLNPRVNVTADEGFVTDKSDEFFSQFDVVVACNLDLKELIRINRACRQAQKPFYASEIPGMTGYIFADLVSHGFVTEREEVSSKGERQKVTVPGKEDYISLEEALTHDYGATLRPKLRKKVSVVLPLSIALLRYRDSEKGVLEVDLSKFRELVQEVTESMSLQPVDNIEDYAQGLDCELSAVAAIVGGILSQDVLNVLSRREFPIQNFFVYDGDSGEGPIYKL